MPQTLLLLPRRVERKAIAGRGDRSLGRDDQGRQRQPCGNGAVFLRAVAAWGRGRSRRPVPSAGALSGVAGTVAVFGGIPNDQTSRSRDLHHRHDRSRRCRPRARADGRLPRARRNVPEGTPGGGSGDDRLCGASGADTLSGGDGDDDIGGLGGDDVLGGGDGDDFLDGDTGNDILIGGPGQDQVCLGFGFPPRNRPRARARCAPPPPPGRAANAARRCSLRPPRSHRRRRAPAAGGCPVRAAPPARRRAART
jgi:hypothetical protein